MIMSMTREARPRAATMRIAMISALLVLVAAVVTACGSDGGAEGQVAASCDSIRDIRSYRYTINLKLKTPAFDSGGPSATPASPLSAFADALQALFSDLKLDGAYRAPDRTQAVLRFQDEELELRQVGDKSWIRVENTWREQDPEEEATTLTPEVVCRDIVDEITPSLANVDSERDTINGIEADHYQLDEADLTRLPELLGTNPQTDLPEQFRVDVWLAREGRFPVRLDVGAEDEDAQGNPIALSLFMEFRDLNDPGITVEPPVLSSPGR